MPKGAAPILAARKLGKKPADLVLLSMMGDLPNEANPVVQLHETTSYDWGWIRGLSACFWVTPENYQRQQIIEASKAQPARLYLWDCAHKKGYDLFVVPTPESIGQGSELWVWKVDTLPWLAFQNKAFALGEHACN